MTAHITPPPAGGPVADRTAPNRATRRARGTGATPPSLTGRPTGARGTVSTTPVRHRTEYAARRGG